MNPSIATNESNMNYSIDQIAEKICGLRSDGKSIVFIYGNFNVIHPGHLRLIKFAKECGDVLVAGLFDDSREGVLIPSTDRIEGLDSISLITFSFVLPCEIEEFVSKIKPDTIVKGKEHEGLVSNELSILNSYGGRLVFSSGEAQFSSLKLLVNELEADKSIRFKAPFSFCKRHNIVPGNLVEIISNFSKINVVVVGDLIVDEYITTEPLGMSREDPTIVVTPVQSDMFLGGAAIVAAHASALGANVNYFGISGDDEISTFADEMLRLYNVHGYLISDTSRPTTLKQRFRASGKTLLRVSHLRQHQLNLSIGLDFAERIKKSLSSADLLVFSDFSYGALPQWLVDDLTSYCISIGVPVVADSQSSSQTGDISRFKNALLLSPTEHEVRTALKDHTSGLVVMAERLARQSDAKYTLITLGAEGVLIYSTGELHGSIFTDQLPAFNSSPVDVSGAGDCLLMATSLGLAVGATIWESAYIGSLAAGFQVANIGNIPISLSDITEGLGKL